MTVAPEDIAVDLGRTAALTSAEEAQWDRWISDALLLIKARLGDPAELDQDNLDYVVRQAVVAQVQRPDDATTVDVRVDDASVAKTYRSSSGRVTIRDEWWSLLDPDSAASGAFSITPYGARSQHAPWCHLMFDPTSTCSCGVALAGWPMYEPVD